MIDGPAGLRGVFYPDTLVGVKCNGSIRKWSDMEHSRANVCLFFAFLICCPTPRELSRPEPALKTVFE